MNINMKRKFKNGKAFIWMQLLGFERNDQDCGASRYLAQTGFTPDGICALVFHSDIVNQHRGMDEEYTLPPDNCSYYGIPYNIERERQPWTNYNLRTLSNALHDSGSNLYISIMGKYLDNAFHDEWASEHLEILYDSKESRSGMNVLKHLSDGTLYEDFFVDKLCQVLVDYQLDGIHLADGFCPMPGTRNNGDFSSDMVKQFVDHTSIILPEKIEQGMGCDTIEQKTLRGNWIWKYKREEWLHFYVWRWESFFKKICKRVHSIGKKVIVLGMYCTDPFETLYCLGFDMASAVRAGVDYLTPNILPTSVYMDSSDRPYYFHRYMSIIPLTAAHIPEANLLSMLGVQDASEEWDVLHHAPCRIERDLYTMLLYQLATADGCQRSLDGLLLCLGDGIHSKDWTWLSERMEIAFSADVEQCLTPAVLWSDTAYENMLNAYIHTRRWTTHKFVYEMAKSGTLCGEAVRSENISSYEGTLFVPNFDLLSEKEKFEVAAYTAGAVVCTASPGFDPSVYGINSNIIFEDRFSAYPMVTFAFNSRISSETLAKIETLLSVDDGSNDLDCAPEDAYEYDFTLNGTLTFAKVTEGFKEACALLLKKAGEEYELFTCNVPFTAMRLKGGQYRLYCYNTHEEKYNHALVISSLPILKVKIISKYPVLPVRYIDTKNTNLLYKYKDMENEKFSFQTKIQPSGVTIVDVYIA